MASQQRPKQVVIIGAGIGGLCAGVYLRNCGYHVQIVERHSLAGGLCTCWSRGGYTFETGLHWFTGARPGGLLYDLWEEVFDIGQLQFHRPAAMVWIEDADGQSFTFWADVERLEQELRTKAPDDRAEVDRLMASVRKLIRWKIPSPADRPLTALSKGIRSLPCLITLRQWMQTTTQDYARRWHNPLLQRFFTGGVDVNISMLATMCPLVWTINGDGAYPRGGSQAIIGGLLDRYQALGGELRYNAEVEQILVEQGRAVGVRLQGGETLPADVVISAADGHTTLYRLLPPECLDAKIEKPYKAFKAFPSYIQVSLGVAREYKDVPGNLILLQPSPLRLDPQTAPDEILLRIFNYDDQMAPPGKTAMTTFMPTHNYDYWRTLRDQQPQQYRAEKQRIGQEVIERLSRRLPGLKEALEVVDVATPATVHRYTHNWRGSMGGWLITPGQPFMALRNTLARLKDFYMVGHWIQPGSGLPTGVMTARATAQAICKRDRVRFTPKGDK